MNGIICGDGIARNVIDPVSYTHLCYAMAAGKLDGKDSAQVADYFTGLQDSAGTMTLWMIIVVVLSFGVCSLGVQRGLEKRCV